MVDVCIDLIEAKDDNKSKIDIQLVIQKSTFDSTLKNMEKIYKLGHEVG